MVALAASALSGLGSLFGIGASTAPTGLAGGIGYAAPAAATTAGMSSGVLTALQTFAAGLTAFGQLGAASAAASATRDQAREARLEAGQEQVASVQRQTAMKRELSRVLGANKVAFAAAGIDLAGGIAEDSAANEKKRAAQELSIDSRDSEFRAAPS